MHLRSRPSGDGLAAVAAAVAPGSKATRIRRLGGGISTATSAVRLVRPGQSVDIVIKRFRTPGLEAREEWKRLVFAQRLPVPSPEPIAFDARGEWFGAPTIVMSRLDGRPDVRPADVHPWLDQIARSQLAIHEANTIRAPAFLRKSPDAKPWSLPEGLRRSAMLERAEALVNERTARAWSVLPVFGHGDPHPGNLLWARRKISGIADWQAARICPRGREVAYMRADIAVLLGVRASEMYRSVYEEHLGDPVDDLAYWDLIQGITAMRYCVLWVHPYREQGAVLTIDRARRRARQFVGKALERAERER